MASDPNNAPLSPTKWRRVVSRTWRGARQIAAQLHRAWAGRSSTAVIRPGRQRRPGSKLPLLSLAPMFDAQNHLFYADLLNRAIRDPDIKSIALTGAYGTGKSSVLRALRRNGAKRRKMVELSLSSLDPRMETPTSSNPAENSASNRIQKEIVKQLLYRLAPSRTPHSRFPRASGPTFRSAVVVVGVSAAAVGVFWLVVAFTDLQATLESRLEDLGWPAAAFWAGLVVAASLVGLIAWRTLSGRYAVQAGVKAGALTVSLQPSSSSYFDQYLDEIMYFFQVSRTTIVFVEDVDRFEDATVLDTLRALNHLLNSSKQVGRRVVFVYAIRDSIMGQIGQREDHETLVHAHIAHESVLSLELARANRAKYFDVIIPIVPFVSTVTARDLMMKTLGSNVADESGDGGISPALVRLAARHVADMRTIQSIKNEYEIHADRLIHSAEQRVPDISPSIVFALVLLRATSPLTYENIRLSNSNLDRLTERWIDLVDENLDAQTKRLTRVHAQIEARQAQNGRAEAAAQVLEKLRIELAEGSQLNQAQVQYSGPLSDGNLADIAGWRSIAAGRSLDVNVTPGLGYGGTPQYFSLGADVLARLLRMPLDPMAWNEADVEDLGREKEEAEREISFLRHHTWQDLYRRADLSTQPLPQEAHLVAVERGTHDQAEDARVSFADLVNIYAPTRLCRDLIEFGYLPRHFARYSATFYDQVLSLDAAEYISRAIEPGVPILEYELSDEHIRQILTEQGASADSADLFEDQSLYNLDILAYLLHHRPGAARVMASRIASRWGDLEKNFIDRFLQREPQQTVRRVVEAMAPSWAVGLAYLVGEANVAAETRTQLVDAMLGAVAEGPRDDLDSDVASFLSEHSQRFSALRSPVSAQRASIVMAVYQQAGALVSELGGLDEAAVAAAEEHSVYPISASNLEVLGRRGSIALDVLAEDREAVYAHCIGHLDQYLSAIGELGTHLVLESSEAFLRVVDDAATNAELAALVRLVRATPTSCTISDLSAVAPEAWPAVVGERRTAPSYANVRSYIDAFGVDMYLGAFLTDMSGIEVDDSVDVKRRLVLAYELLAAREAIPDGARRVSLVASLRPGTLTVRSISAEEGYLVGQLISAGLLEDGRSSFSSKLLADWGALETAIVSSENFVNFVDPTVLPPVHLAEALRSRRLDEPLKDHLIRYLAEQLEGATAMDAESVADAIVDMGLDIDVHDVIALRDLGTAPRTIVRLLNQQASAFDHDEVRSVLRGMGGDYERLASGGQGVVRFDLGGEHETLLERLQGITHTGAKENYTKSHGLKLEANLKQLAL